MKTRVHERTKHDALQDLIAELKKASTEHKVKLWRAVASELERPTRSRRAVNVCEIERHAAEGEIALVPGKVLSMGIPSKKITVAAYRFSGEAQRKINENGQAMTIQELLKKNPQGKNVRIIG